MRQSSMLNNKLPQFFLLISLLMMPMAFWACSGGGSGGSEPDPGSSIDQGLLLKNITESIIAPTYQQLSLEGESLKNQIEDFCANPNLEKLQLTQDQWKSAHRQLKLSEAYAVGPYMMDNLDAPIDFWPTRPDNIEAAILNHESFPPETLQSLGASVVGFKALEYLLFDPALGNDEILKEFSSDENAEKRCLFLTALGEDLRSKLSQLETLWSKDSGNYTANFANAGANDSGYDSQHSAISELLNRMAITVDFARDKKVGKPLGLNSGGTPQPDLVENPFSGHSLEAIKANLTGLKNVYHPSGNQLGIYDLLKSKTTSDAPDELETQINDAIAAVSAIKGPLSQAVIDQPELVQAAYDKIKTIRDNLYGWVASVLGVTTAVSDTDGD